jgi:hypothetical protein
MAMHSMLYLVELHMDDDSEFTKSTKKEVCLVTWGNFSLSIACHSTPIQFTIIKFSCDFSFYEIMHVPLGD